MTLSIQGLKDLPAQGKLYFVGIGGISMSGLAELAFDHGYRVTGSDRQASPHTLHLESKGIKVFIGQESLHIDSVKPDLLIHTAAVHPDNPELVRARELNLPIVDRATFLGWLTADFNRVINIAGTHGKTTVTAMCSLMLLAAGQDPTIHIGAELKELNHNTVRSGQDKNLLVSEACEYTNSYHHFESTTAAILNIDIDHLDFFKDLADIIHSFAVFTDKIRDDGYLVLPHYGKHMGTLWEQVIRRRQASRRPLPKLVTCGSAEPNEQEKKLLAELATLPPAVAETWPDRPTFAHTKARHKTGHNCFEILTAGQEPLSIELLIPGLHNVENATMAAACALLNGATPAACRRVLSTFTGAEGRYTVKGTYKGAVVVTDYAHHPAATRATLAAAAEMPYKRVWVVYQPLTFSRVKLFFDDYVAALKNCRHTIFIEIYSDREQDDLGMSSRQLCEAINRLGGSAEFAPDFEAVVAALDDRVAPGDAILFLGPEQVRSYGDRLITLPDGRAMGASE